MKRKKILMLILPLAFTMCIALQSKAQRNEDTEHDAQPTLGDYYKGESLYGQCVTCHTREPKFAGKPVTSLIQAMQHFKKAKLDSPLLKAKKKIFANLSKKDIQDLATYLNEL